MKYKAFLRLAAGVLAVMMLTGCGVSQVLGPKETEVPVQIVLPGATEAMQETEASPTCPPDGNPGDETCKGSYTGEPSPSAVAATSGDGELTMGQLQVLYWGQVAAWKQSEETTQPDYSQGLDTQLREDGRTWQQFFLARALNAWHTAQALYEQSQEVDLPLEEAYQPDPEKHEEYIVDIPATKFLYGENRKYSPNTMHQAYLDNLSQTLQELAKNSGYADAQNMALKAFGTTAEDLQTATELLNRGYMYFTELTYHLEAPAEAETAEGDENAQETVTADGGEKTVDIRELLLTPQEGETMEDCQVRAEKLLAKAKAQWNWNEAYFRTMAHDESQDKATAPSGGTLNNVKPGQLPQEMDSWSFDAERQPGDTTIIPGDDGVYILYFAASRTESQSQAEQTRKEDQEKALIDAAKEAYPMTVNYGDIRLSSAEGNVSVSDLLYPDVAHERFPEVPVYLQQDYGKTPYGNYRLSSHGCGITSLAMLATYMADEEYTPPMLSARYGNYCHENGTDGTIFPKEAAALGFYCLKRAQKADEALEALKEGKIVVSVQTVGYWTRGGHYLVVEKYFPEDDTVQVRDSNLYNYKRIEAHKQDRHAWSDVTKACCGYWIFDYKIKTIPFCDRCGDGSTTILEGGYLCDKCRTAMLRRSTYLLEGAN